MLKKEELRQLRVDFWSAFEDFNKKKRTSNNRKINWAQYKSGIKDIYFRMDFTTHEAFFAIDLQMRDAAVRALVWEQFMETEKLLKLHIGDEIQHQESLLLEEGFEIHRMRWSMEGVSIANEEDYEKVIQYLSEKIYGLDRFWYEFSDLFNALCR